MELTGHRLLATDRASVWRALNDPEILRQAIPGCESIEAAGDSRYQVAVVASLGPVRARFKGSLALDDVVEPVSYTLRFEGQGGAAGFAKGSAQVTLNEIGRETHLDYAVKAQIGGRIAQVGNRLVDSAALKLADDFFAAFERLVAPPAVDAAAQPPTPSAEPATPLPPAFGARGWKKIAWMAAFVAAVVVVAFVLR